jgi:hypothetical protein
MTSIVEFYVATTRIFPKASNMNLSKHLYTLGALTLLCGCNTVYQQKSEVLYEFPKDNAIIYRYGYMPVAAFSNVFVIVSRDQIYKITDYDFKNPKLICDARRPGWEIAARFGDGANALKYVTGITCAPDGKIYFCDGRVNEVLSDGQYRVVAGSIDNDYVDSTDGCIARFGTAMGISYWKGKLVVADCFNNALRLVNPGTGEVRTLLGRRDESFVRYKYSSSFELNPASTDGCFDVATLRDPFYVCSQVESDFIIVVCNEISMSFSEYTVRRIDMKTHSVITLAGKTYSAPEIKDGPYGRSRLVNTESATMDDKGNVYIANDNFIRRISNDGMISTIYANFLKSGERGWIKVLLFDSKKSSLILIDDESVKSIKLLKQ